MPILVKSLIMMPYHSSTSIIIHILAKSVRMGKVIFLLALIALVFGQQICLKEECAQQLAGCGDDCVVSMGKCMFTCTMGSQGCLQKCLGDNAPALSLLECSFNKCINL